MTKIKKRDIIEIVRKGEKNMTLQESWELEKEIRVKIYREMLESIRKRHENMKTTLENVEDYVLRGFLIECEFSSIERELINTIRIYKGVNLDD